MVPGYQMSAHFVTLFYVRKKFTDINVSSLHDIRASFHVLAKVAHNLIARFDLFCFNPILLRRFSCKHIKKKLEEIEDVSELHLLNKYCLVLNQRKKTIYYKIKCGKR